MSDADDILQLDIAKLRSVQEVRPEELVRRSQLGEDFNFSDVVPVIANTVAFYKKIPADSIGTIPPNQRQRIVEQATNFLDLVERIRAFRPATEDNAAVARKNLVDEADRTYQATFDNLHHLVSYFSSSDRDYSTIETAARKAADSALAVASDLQAQIQQRAKEADTALLAIRSVAAERGVTQQAEYFKLEADGHDTKAAEWLKYTISISVGLVIYGLVALASTFLFEPKSVLQGVQISVAKVLIFSVVAYMLFQSARTFSAHQHNAAVNRHRQNSLMSFNSLVQAAGSEDKRDIVLTAAATSIFVPQDTGYVRNLNSPQMPMMQIVEALPKSLS